MLRAPRPKSRNRAARRRVVRPGLRRQLEGGTPSPRRRRRASPRSRILQLAGVSASLAPGCRPGRAHRVPSPAPRAEAQLRRQPSRAHRDLRDRNEAERESASRFCARLRRRPPRWSDGSRRRGASRYEAARGPTGLPSSPAATGGRRRCCSSSCRRRRVARRCSSSVRRALRFAVTSLLPSSTSDCFIACLSQLVDAVVVLRDVVELASRARALARRPCLAACDHDLEAQTDESATSRSSESVRSAAAPARASAAVAGSPGCLRGCRGFARRVRGFARRAGGLREAGGVSGGGGGCRRWSGWRACGRRHPWRAGRA